jgi:hypothetical protein
MLKEERQLREYLRAAVRYKCHFTPATNREMYALTTALVRAVREDCAKVAEEYAAECTDDSHAIAAAIRGRK